MKLKGTFVGGRGGFVGQDPLVPSSQLGVTGLNNMMRGTFVGGAGNGLVGAEPLIPGRFGPYRGVTGLVSMDINEIKKEIKEKYSRGIMDVICEGLMLGSSGLAKGMRNTAYGLSNCGCNVRTIILDGDNIGSGNTEVGRRVIALSNNHSVSSSGGFYITMNTPLGVGFHPGFYNIAYVMFETVDFPQSFANHLKGLGGVGIHEIWTPSQFCKDTMIASGLDENIIKVMPLGVDTRMFSKEVADEPRHIYGNVGGPLIGKFKFLTVMSYSERKGISLLIRAFVEEFGLGNEGLDAGKVALYLKEGWYPAGVAIGDIERMVLEIPGIINSGINSNRPYIAYDFNIYSDEVLASLYKACDAFVLPSRGEGFGYPLAEAMSMGMPTIGTRWSGNLEFMNDENSYLIDIEGFAEEPRCNWLTPYYHGQRFAIPSVSHLRQLMRYVYEHREEGIEKSKIARDNMVNHFDLSVCAARAKTRLDEIARN